MQKKYKIQEIKITSRRILYRKEGNYYYAYCRETLLFFMFNQLGLEILNFISRGIPFNEQIKKITKQYTLIESDLKKYLKAFVNSLITQDLIKLKDAQKLGFDKSKFSSF